MNGSFRWVLLCLTLASSWFGCASGPEPTRTLAETEPGSSGLLIRNASLMITMDPALGDGPLGIVEGGDVLLEGGRIAAVGKGLDGSGRKSLDARGKIVMPGFVDTHDHLWQSIIRGCAADQELYGWLEACVYPMGRVPFGEQDAYAAARLATLGLIGTGVTTVLDWSHAFNPAFVDGNLGALGDSGLRFVFAYWVAPPGGCSEAARIQQDLVGNGLAAGFQVATHPTLANLDQLKEAVRCAEKLHVPLNVHLGESPKDPQQGQIQALELSGALDGQMLADHAIHLTDREVELLARHRVAVAHNPLSNMRLASGIMRLPEMHGAGLRIGLGLDGGTGDGPDMFADMKAAVGLQRARLESASGYPGIADVLRMATLGGAEALGLDKITGSLTPGKRADLIVLDPGGANIAPRWDWPSQIVLNGQPANVEYVFVDGRALKSEGKLAEGQEKNAVQAAEAAARRVRAALGDRRGLPPAGHD